MIQFPVGSNVEETARGVVGAGAEGVAVREELDGVDVRLVAGEGLDSLAGADVPQLGKGVAGAGNEDVLVRRVDADAHDVAEVVGELGHARARVDVPEHAGHVARRRQDAAVVDETAARQVARVARELARDPGRAFPRREVVDGADVVEAAAGDVIAARRVGARHDPGRPQRDGVDLVGRVRVPDDELAVLRGRHQRSPVRGPVHGVDLGEMPLQRSSRLHADAI